MDKKTTSEVKENKEPSTSKKEAPKKISASEYIQNFMAEVDRDFSALLTRFRNAEMHTVEEWHKVLHELKNIKIF